MPQTNAASGDHQYSEAENSYDQLWPSADYQHQIALLSAAIGETVYLAELDATDTQLGVRVTDHPYQLLALVDFPRPDPARGLAPHLVVLDDGRGINLGRIARISRCPFDPTPADLLYLDRFSEQRLLFAKRRLCAEQIRQRSRETLGRALGYSQPALTPHLPRKP